jgi:hypothetical protein
MGAWAKVSRVLRRELSFNLKEPTTESQDKNV